MKVLYEKRKPQTRVIRRCVWGFLRYRIVGLNLFLPVEIHAIHPDDDERDAEPLAHVQRHALLKGHLVRLQEFHEEAEDEYLRQAQSEVEAAAMGVGGGQGCSGSLLHADGFVLPSLQAAAVEIQHAQAEDEVGDGLVQLCRMAGFIRLARRMQQAQMGVATAMMSSTSMKCIFVLRQ